MQTITINQQVKLSDGEVRQLRNLWNNEYPLSLNYLRVEDFVLYLTRLENARHYFIKNEEESIVAWAFDFKRDTDQWFGIIVDSSMQGKGFGTLLLNKLKENNTTLNGWMIDRDTDIKSNGQYYKSPAEFYKKNAFKLNPLERMGFDKISAIKITWKQN